MPVPRIGQRVRFCCISGRLPNFSHKICTLLMLKIIQVINFGAPFVEGVFLVKG